MNLIFATTSVVLVTIDQVSKYLVRIYLKGKSLVIIKSFLSLTFVRNEGAVFGLFQGTRFVLILLSLIALAIILLIFKKVKFSLTFVFALSLVFAGVLGNLIDRIFLGYVTDFINIGKWPVFNVADTSIDFGIVLLIISVLKGENVIQS